MVARTLRVYGMKVRPRIGQSQSQLIKYPLKELKAAVERQEIRPGLSMFPANPRLGILGYLPCQYDARRILDREVLALQKKRFKRCFPRHVKTYPWERVPPRDKPSLNTKKIPMAQPIMLSWHQPS
jgi:hypothetical protein